CKIPATGGLPMLVAQGYFASRLFAGGSLGLDPVGRLTDSEQKLIEKVIAEITDSVSNIVLYGMPGSGKSSVGRVVAHELGLDFVDTDDIFTSDNFMTPAYCITQRGEKEFRALEKQAVYKAASVGRRVIATGGGVVLDPENTELLALNGRSFFLNRKLSDLATRNRPLSEGDENLKALYYKRLPIYLSSSETVIDVDTDVKGMAQKIMDSLHNSDSKKIKILVINGPNLNMLGIREPDIYGRQTYEDLIKLCREKADELGVEVSFYQSNHEGDLVDIIQQSYGTIDGIVINPGAYTHTSVALLDALKCVGIPAIEVHISDVDSREEFRQTSYIRYYVRETITGHGLTGYTEAMGNLWNFIIKGGD
ncbi:MAG: type II 3-dehydroquinate dehydratase, partial [Lachnospiraceae bacterium]|nr:type II 3-dehydroquinate dehydratase [Lachnospiraceae bacterium]